MKRVYVADIQERDQVEAPFLVRDKIVGMAKNGRPYLTLKLMDRTGEVEGRIWDRVDELSAQFGKDDFVHVSGKASVYMGKMQLVIQALQRLDETGVDLGDFLPLASRSVASMSEELRAVVQGLSNPHLQRLMEAFLADESFMAAYLRAPAAKSMHHVYLGGLLEHSLAVAALAADVSRRYPALDRDLLVVGALLHDVGKIAELRYQRSFEYTDAGKLLGHIVMGVEMVEAQLRTLGDFPRDLALHLKHLLLSHHGQYEYGSPKRPKTLEAVVLNFLDDLDSKINGVRTHIEREPESESAWTQYHKQYDRYFFKGNTEAKPSNAPPLATARPVSPMTKPAAAPTPRTKFGNSLGAQLKGLKIDLAGVEKQDKTDE